MNNTEKQIAQKLLANALLMGLQSSKQFNDLGHTDMDTIEFWANGVYMGFVLLIWGNDIDLTSNWSDNEAMNKLIDSLEVV